MADVSIADTTAEISVDALVGGTRILYPHERRNGAPELRAVTVSRIVEYPASRLLYFTEGGYGISDRGGLLDLAVGAADPEAIE